jgi:hypothetical protein
VHRKDISESGEGIKELIVPLRGMVAAVSVEPTPVLCLGRLRLSFAFDGEIEEEEPQSHGDCMKDQIPPYVGVKACEPLTPGEDLSHERDDSAKPGKAQYRSENPP